MRSCGELTALLFPKEPHEQAELTGAEWREIIFQAYEHCTAGPHDRNDCGGRTADERAISALREMAESLLEERFGE